MEISGKVLREVEFRDRLRGYDTDEVDEFLEKVAVAVDELRAELEQAARRAERAERRAAEAAAEAAAAPAPAAAAAPPAAPEAGLDDDAIRRTLVLAQRTADLAIAEAREEATRMLDEAHAESESMLSRAEDSARRTREQAEVDVRTRLGHLGEERERLEREIQELSQLVEGERARLTESLTNLLRSLGESLAVSDALAQHQAVSAAQASAPAPQSYPSPAPAAPAAPAAPSEDRWPPAEATATENAWPPAEETGTGNAWPPAPSEGGPAAPEAAPAGEQPPGAHLVPDVENEIAEDAATAYGGGFFGGSTGRVRALPNESDEAEEELWQRWAAGRDLGVVPAPSDFPNSDPRFRGGPGGGLSA